MTDAPRVINTHRTLEGMGPRSGRARREGCEEGHSRQRTHIVFLHRMTQRQRVFAWGGSIALAKSSYPARGEGVGTVGKVTRRDELSGLLVAVLDNQPTDKRTHQSDFSTRGLGSAHVLPASGAKVINHLSPLPVACRHVAPPSRLVSVKGASLCPMVKYSALLA